MQDINSLQFQQLDLDGLKTLVAWAQQEGWNPGKHDAGIFYNTDPDGFCGYYRDGELIAGGSIVSYNGDFGFMGFFIVRPDLRGNGIGRKIWYQRRDKLLSRLKPSAPIGMDGVVAMQPFYHKGGFNLAFRDVRHEKTGEPYTTAAEVSPITDTNLDAILAYDRQCFGYDRRHFMQQWLTQPEAATFKYMKDNELKGFAVIRKADKGYRIGPLFADDMPVAEELYKACLNAAIGEPVHLDIPMANEAALLMAKKFDAESQFECGRMYYGTPPVNKIEKVFGVTSFELG